MGFAVSFYAVGAASLVAAWGVAHFSRESIGPDGEVLVKTRAPAYAGQAD